MIYAVLVASVTFAADALQHTFHGSELETQAEGDRIEIEGHPTTIQNSGAMRRYSWFAESWGPCKKRADAQDYRHRTVKCVNIFGMNATPAPEMNCDPVHKPCPYTKCYCGAVICDNATGVLDTEPTCWDDPLTYRAPQTSEFLGCLKDTALLIPDDALGDEGLDLCCMSVNTSQACNGGLSFYRKDLSPNPTSSRCAKFCTTKGMDVSALFPGGECRCGATPLNTAILHRGAQSPHPALLFMETALDSMPEDCEVSIYRWAGMYVAGAVPPVFVETTAIDDTYIDSVITGHIISEETYDVMQFPNEGANDEQSDDGKEPSWNRNCWPSNCGPGDGPWTSRVTDPLPGLEDRYLDYVQLRYVFDAGVDYARQDAFRLGVQRWHAAACIHFIEVDTLSDPTTYDLKVVVENVHSCYTRGVGNQKVYGDSAFSIINLGWCNNIGQLGSIVHEIGHTLGMKHEQSRPDATEPYFGHGPFIQVYWDSLTVDWQSQWLPDAAAYTGSAYDGVGDPVVGYAPYDFQSIMQYGISAKRGQTFPPEARDSTGQRRALSPGDVRQIWDTYQCVPRRTTTTTTTPPYPHFTITDDFGQYYWSGLPMSCQLSTDKTCVQSFGYPISYAAEQNCVFTPVVDSIELHVMDFDTELAYDFLYVADIGYSGATSPHGITVNPGERIIWTSDYSVNNKGWKICAPPKPADTTTTNRPKTQTTTTSTTTTTTTSTTSTTATRYQMDDDTTTTQPMIDVTPPAACWQYCQRHRQDWTTKCRWSTCSTCQQCVDGHMCKNWCGRHGMPWRYKCNWDGCTDCSECAPYRDSSTPKECRKWCTAYTSGWADRCLQTACAACSQCDELEADTR